MHPSVHLFICLSVYLSLSVLLLFYKSFSPSLPLSLSFSRYLSLIISISLSFSRSLTFSPPPYFPFQPVFQNWCNKGRGICYPVCGMVHIKESLLLIGKSSPCGGSGFPLNGPLPYVRRHITVNKYVLSVALNKTFLFFLPHPRCFLDPLLMSETLRKTEKMGFYYVITTAADETA